MKASRIWACVCGGSPAQTWWGGSVGGAARSSRGNGSCCPAEVAGGHSIGIGITHLLTIGDQGGRHRHERAQRRDGQTTGGPGRDPAAEVRGGEGDEPDDPGAERDRAGPAELRLVGDLD